MFKISGFCLLTLIVLVVGYATYMLNGMLPDHDSPDYQRRIEYIWSGDIPYQPTEADKADIKRNTNFIVKFIQQFFELPDNKPYLVVYTSSTPNSPAVVVAPGGSYILRAEAHEGIDVAKWLNSIGVTAFVLNYRLDRHPAPLSDAQRAIQYVRANALRFNIDPQRLGIMGFSAGGHLASTAATHFLNGDSGAVDPISRLSSRPDFMMLGYPVISFGEIGHLGSRDMLIGPHPTAELINNLSNEKQVTVETPPTFIWTAKTDGLVDYRNAVVFADALKEKGVPAELHVFPEGSHGTGLAAEEKYAKAWPELAEKWLRKMGVVAE